MTYKTYWGSLPHRGEVSLVGFPLGHRGRKASKSDIQRPA